MANLDRIQSVIEKIVTVPGLGEHVCFFGGSIPYLYHHQESNRDHFDIDVLVDEDFIGYARDILMSSSFYNPELDSINLDIGDDYGLKVFIDGVYVELEPFSIKNGMFTRKSFSPNKQVAGIEKIPYDEISDIIVPFEINGKKSFCQSVEMIKVSKEIYRREKDIYDIEFIDAHGYDNKKYQRVKKDLSFCSDKVQSYDELRATKAK